jgi:hypothetical protein
MKTVKRGSEVKRVSDAEAAKAVKAGWAYCPKADWKVLRICSANAPLERLARSDNTLGGVVGNSGGDA